MQAIKHIENLNEIELKNGLIDKASWHDQFKSSAYCYIGGLPFDYTEKDILKTFSQYGEIIDLELMKDKETDKSLGFCFICFEDQRSTVLTVDNFNGTLIDGRMIRVDHSFYEHRKKRGEEDDEFDERIRTRQQQIFPYKLGGSLQGEPQESSNLGLDVNDPMYEYMLKQEKKKRKHKKSRK